MKDWLGNEFGPGDIVLYAASSGRSITMVLAEVVKINETGAVRVQPLLSSRWKQHYGRTYYIDTRNGKRIDPWRSRKHIKNGGYYIDKRTSKRLTEHQRTRSLDDFGVRPNPDYVPYEFQGYKPIAFQPWVEKHEEGPRPVTLTVTKNITLIERADGLSPGWRCAEK